MPSFQFDDLSIEVDGVFIGTFSGDCEVAPDGRIETITVDGFRGGKEAPLHLTVPIGNETRMATWRDVIATILACDLENQYRSSISEAIADHAYERKTEGREHDANEVH